MGMRTLRTDLLVGYLNCRVVIHRQYHYDYVFPTEFRETYLTLVSRDNFLCKIPGANFLTGEDVSTSYTRWHLDDPAVGPPLLRRP